MVAMKDELVEGDMVAINDELVEGDADGSKELGLAESEVDDRGARLGIVEGVLVGCTGAADTGDPGEGAATGLTEGGRTVGVKVVPDTGDPEEGAGLTEGGRTVGVKVVPDNGDPEEGVGLTEGGRTVGVKDAFDTGDIGEGAATGSYVGTLPATGLSDGDALGRYEGSPGAFGAPVPATKGDAEGP